jgi:hypothetical protein
MLNKSKELNNMKKITKNEVADMLGCSDISSDIDYWITECATKGVACIVYFYEDKLNEEDQITAI